MKRLIALLIVFSLAVSMLSGCGSLISAYGDRLVDGMSALDTIKANIRKHGIPYEEMEYQRPDPEELTVAVQDALDAAQDGNVAQTMELVYEIFDLYDWFYTNMALANIAYSRDLTNEYWSEEYGYCAEASAGVDAGLEELYYGLADSPIVKELEAEAYFGEGFFDAYQGENYWDETLTALLEEEAALENRYYALSETALSYTYGTDAYFDACGDEMVELLVQLIGLRQEIAACFGYSDYTQFAADSYYYRDYTMEQAAAYLEDIRTELVPLFTELYFSPTFYINLPDTTESQTYRYVESMAENMGGTVAAAFERMVEAGLYDISYSDTKYNSSFEIYLASYDQPFVFMNPQGSAYDHLTFAHEFGHFCNDYASAGSYAGVDVAEVFSQAMEYLSLCYAEDGSSLTRLKLWDSMALFIQQGYFARFEMEMYSLTGEDLTAENLRALYAKCARDYGFSVIGFDDREFVSITHFYTAPMYIMSYLVSNDAALQMYQLELEEPGQGLARLEATLDTQCSYFLDFIREAELESPFTAGRMAQIRAALETALR